VNNIVLVASIFLCAFSAIAVDTVIVGNFSAADLTGWEVKEFDGKTHYQLDEIGGTRVLKAVSEATASGLVKKQHIDLHKTPYLQWRWRIENRLQAMNEKTRVGDDYAARVYVIVNGGWAFWKTRAINYVWSANQQKQTVWPNAFVGENAVMIALRNQHDATGVWYQQKRNVKMDFKQQFGEDIQYIDALAIMTDTDNAKGHAVSYYGDIFFSAD